MRTVLCVSFVAFSVDFSQLLSQSCTSEIALPRACRADDFGWFGHGVHCFAIFPAFFVFFRGGSNMVAFRAKVDGTWQAQFQRRLRYRVAGLRPSGLPNLPFSLSLPFPPSSSNSFLFPNVFSNFSSFHPFPSSLPFFFFISQFTSNFPSLPSISRFFPRFLVNTFLKQRLEQNSTMMSTSHLPRSSPIRSGRRSPRDHPKCQEHVTLFFLLLPSPSLSLPFLFFLLFLNSKNPTIPWEKLKISDIGVNF